jgi:hypothetical protein
MGKQCRFSLRHVILFVIIGLYFIVTDFTSKSSLPSFIINALVFREKLFLLFGIEKHIFDETIQHLLFTHDRVYNNPSAYCGRGGKLNPKDNQTLNGVARLLPQLRTQLVQYPHEYFKDRGIVLTVGPNQMPHTRFNLRIIEWSRTKLPVEVWYSSAQISRNLTNELLSSVPTLNVKACCFETARCHSSNGTEINLTRSYVYAPETKHINGKIYTFKPAAILSSTFDEVLFLDADCYVVRDPTYLFEKDPMYKRFGVLLYSDIYLSHQHPKLWSLLNTTCVRNEYSVDSGVLLFNKKRVWSGIYMSKLMSDHPKIFYDYFFSNGDKDVFRLAFRYMKIPYYIISTPCSTGYIQNHTFCGVTLCKTDSLGLNVYFEHVHHPKHLHHLTFLKENFTHTRLALADSNYGHSFITGYCGLYPLPCFQVGFHDQYNLMSMDDYCRNSALVHTETPLVQIPFSQSVLWNPSLEMKLLLMKKSKEIMPGFIDFYFQVQNESMFRNVRL